MKRRGAWLLPMVLGSAAAGCSVEGVRVTVSASPRLERVTRLRVIIETQPDPVFTRFEMSLRDGPTTLPPERSFRLRLPSTGPDGRPLDPAAPIFLRMIALDPSGADLAAGRGSRELHIGDVGEVKILLGSAASPDGGTDGSPADLRAAREPSG